GQKSQAAAKSSIKPNRGDHGAATRSNAHFFAFAKVIPLSVLRRKFQGLLAPERRGVLSRLHASVERIQAAAGGEADGVFVGKGIDGRLKFDRTERRAWSDKGGSPQAAMQKHFAGMRLVVARPLNPAELFEPLVAHPSMHGTQLAQFVPD